MGAGKWGQENGEGKWWVDGVWVDGVWVEVS
jgi:hypothetical protein